MRAMQFKIKVEGLALRDFTEYHREDLDFVIEAGKKNNLNWVPERENLVFTGKHEDLFTFLYDVAYRYDIEIM